MTGKVYLYVLAGSSAFCLVFGGFGDAGSVLRFRPQFRQLRSYYRNQKPSLRYSIFSVNAMLPTILDLYSVAAACCGKIIIVY